MTIFYNPAYSAAPHRNGESRIEAGNFYCGDIQLLQKLLFYAGILYAPATNEERMAHYHTRIQHKIDGSSSFYNSFKTDSAGMSRKVLAWRDALVGAGWEMKAYKGNSAKLAFIRDIEQSDKPMPCGEADYWFRLGQIASERRILPEEFDIVVTCDKDEIRPNIAHILAAQSEMGVNVAFCPISKPCAEGNLGKIQSAILSQSKEKIVLDEKDDTFSYIKFTTDDDALRYVATQPVDAATLYYCSTPKRFDNTLKLLGKPTIGSSLVSAAPQVAQLFILGNGLFEYPINIHRIIAWLNMPISPINRGLRRVLSNVLIKVGGINNKEWKLAMEEYLNTVEDPKERAKIDKQYDNFLPIPQSEAIDTETVRAFNDNLRKWAVKLLAMEKFPYDDIVREQIASVQSYCTSLIAMLDDAPEGLRYLDLQLWCRNIAQPSVFGQYGAEATCHNTIAAIGDIHDTAESIVWFPAEDCGTAAYPFEMLNYAEYAEAESCGAKLYHRNQHTRIYQAAVLRILLNTKRLTIIEADKSNGNKVARHPLVLQLNERIAGGLQSIAQTREMPQEYTEKSRQVVNRSANPDIVMIDKQVTIKERHERYADVAQQAESYSSLSQLIQHPFAYVCERCANLDDYTAPSAQDLNRTLGNVAHLIIEKVFTDKSVTKAVECYQHEYDAIFEEAVDEKGLLLRLPEYEIDLRRLKMKMKTALARLVEKITTNGLTVDACEYDFKQAAWRDAGTDVTLGSRADMVLSDRRGGKVIFDFKYSTGKSYKTQIEENRALQLEVYRFMAKQEFGTQTPVRVAYILLPEVTVFTADDFDDIDATPPHEERASADVMAEAARSYRLRWEQLKDGRIERVEGRDVGTGEYAEQQEEKDLFPLDNYNGKYSIDTFDKGYKNLK